MLCFRMCLLFVNVCAWKLNAKSASEQGNFGLNFDNFHKELLIFIDVVSCKYNARLADYFLT